MAVFRVTMANGDRLVIEAGAIDNVPEFVGELKSKGFLAGRLDGSTEAVALVDPHVAIVELV